MIHKILFYFLSILIKSYLTLIELLPYLIVGTLIGESLKYIKLHRLVGRLCSSNRLLSTLIAAVMGIVSPLCTVGTVPIVIRLVYLGMPSTVFIVFLIASSMMNPQLFIMTWGGIDKEIAIARVLTILAFVLLMGLVLRIIPEKYVLNKNKLEEFMKLSHEEAKVNVSFKWKQYFINILKSLEYVGFYVVIGIVVSAAIEVLIPGDAMNKLYGQHKLVQIIIMSFLSIPFYTCGGGVIPIVNAMISGGMSHGVALAFLNVGAATRITVLATMASIVRPLFLFIYILVLITFSIGIGYLYV